MKLKKLISFALATLVAFGSTVAFAANLSEEKNDSTQTTFQKNKERG